MTTPEMTAAERLLIRAGESLDRLLANVDGAARASLLADDATAIEARYEQGLAALAQARYDEAADAFAEAAVARPQVSRYHFALGLCLQQLDGVSAALEQFATALALDATDAAAAFRLGECFHALGQLDDAREALQMAVQLCALPENDPTVRVMTEELLDRIAREGA